MTLVIRRAQDRDLPALIKLLAQLSLGEAREDPSAITAYETAFAAIDADERQSLLVAAVDGSVVGTAAFILVPNLSHVGRPYAVVENVVVDSAVRGKGIGETLMRRAIELAREAGCYKLALTSNRHRLEAHRFYERLGFRATHLGFRLDFA